jgi:Flp pilus assembly protein TadD
LKQGDLNAAEKELSVLLSENILDQRPYKKLVQALVAHGFYDRALPYLYMMERHCGSDFSAEAIGSILLKKEDYPEALPYLEKAVQLDNSDAASWYNAAVAYYYTRKYSQADAAVKQALRLQPRYGAALALKQQLETQAGLK